MSEILQSLGIDSVHLEEHSYGFSDGWVIVEGGQPIGYVKLENLPAQYKHVVGPDGRPGVTGVYVIQAGRIHSFAPLDLLSGSGG